MLQYCCPPQASKFLRISLIRIPHDIIPWHALIRWSTWTGKKASAKAQFSNSERQQVFRHKINIESVGGMYHSAYTYKMYWLLMLFQLVLGLLQEQVKHWQEFLVKKKTLTRILICMYMLISEAILHIYTEFVVPLQEFEMMFFLPCFLLVLTYVSLNILQYANTSKAVFVVWCIYLLIS